MLVSYNRRMSQGMCPPTQRELGLALVAVNANITDGRWEEAVL